MNGLIDNFNQVSGAAIAAVLNSLWQAVAVAGAGWAAMRFIPRMNAATRHVMWWVVLAAILVLPTAPVIRARWQALAVPSQAPDAPAIPAPLPPTLAATGTDAAQVDPIAVTPDPSAHSPAPLELRNGRWPTWIAVLWLAVMLLQLGRVAWSYGYLRRVRRLAHRASPELRRNFDAWMMSCGVHRPARLLVSAEIVSPMAIGFREPAVLLPAPLLQQFQEPELDHVLLHELAHIARQDDWWNLCARLASALLALHPVAIWVLRNIEREREIACDDWVVSMTGAARPYAASLARLFEVCFARRRMLLATGMAQRASQLGERIQRLLRRSREYTPKASMARVALCSAVLLASVVAGAYAPQWLVLAQAAPADQGQASAAAVAIFQTPLPGAAPSAPQAPAMPGPAVAPAVSESAAPVAIPGPAAASTPEAPFAGIAPYAVQDEKYRSEASQMMRLEANLAALSAKGYSQQHPEIVRLEAAIASLREAIQSTEAATPQARSTSAAAKTSFLAALVAAGYNNLPVDEIINLKNAGVTAEFLTGINQAGWGKLSSQQLIDLSTRGVNPEYIRKMKDAGIRDITLQDVTEMAAHGVRPETMQEIHALGFGPYTAKQAIQFAQYGMRVDLFRALKDAGLGNATTSDIVEAQMTGLSVRDLREARQYGPNLTLKQIIKLKMAGVI